MNPIDVDGPRYARDRMLKEQDTQPPPPHRLGDPGQAPKSNTLECSMDRPSHVHRQQVTTKNKKRWQKLAALVACALNNCKTPQKAMAACAQANSTKLDSLEAGVAFLAPESVGLQGRWGAVYPVPLRSEGTVSSICPQRWTSSKGHVCRGLHGMRGRSRDTRPPGKWGRMVGLTCCPAGQGDWGLTDA